MLLWPFWSTVLGLELTVVSIFLCDMYPCFLSVSLLHVLKKTSTFNSSSRRHVDLSWCGIAAVVFYYFTKLGLRNREIKLPFYPTGPLHFASCLLLSFRSVFTRCTVEQSRDQVRLFPGILTLPSLPTRPPWSLLQESSHGLRSHWSKPYWTTIEPCPRPPQAVQAGYA